MALGTTINGDPKVIHRIPEEFIVSQLNGLINENRIEGLKIGLYHSFSLSERIISFINERQIPNVVIDPIIINTHLSSSDLQIFRDQLLPVATLIVVTLNEASILLDHDIVSLEDTKRAAQDLHRLGPKYVFITGHQLPSDTSTSTEATSNANTVIIDVLFDGQDLTFFKSSDGFAGNVHDIRCHFSAAITAYLSHGLDMINALQHAITYAHSINQNSSIIEHNRDLSATKTLTDKREVPVINEQKEHLGSPLQSTDKVIIINKKYWISEPRLLLQKRSFVQLLKNTCSQEWFDYTHHPFVQGLGDGTLPHSSFKHYLIQDYIFLTNFARCHALMAYKSKEMSDILYAAEIICGIARESKVHLSYCEEWGIDTKSLESVPEARANLTYTRFTLDCGMSGDLIDLHVALLPCLLGYGEIGSRLFNDPITKRDSPYWQWITSYASENYQQACREGEQKIEDLANEYAIWWYTDTRMNKLINIFKTATKLEIEFWNMGLFLQE